MSPMILVMVACVAALAIAGLVVLTSVLHRPVRAEELGTVSHRWIAEHHTL
jgi:hypothetical protein